MTLGHELIGESTGTSSDSYPFIVLGRGEKLTPRGPFLDLRAEFAAELQHTSHLVVVGYSFSDEHVNELIRKWQSTNDERILVVVDPVFPRSYLDANNHFVWEMSVALQQQASIFIGSYSHSRLLPVRMTFKNAMSIICAGPKAIDEELVRTYGQRGIES